MVGPSSQKQLEHSAMRGAPMRVFEKILKSLCVILFIEMAIVTFMQVVSRYIFGVSFFGQKNLQGSQWYG
ncbi:MAG: hypothetical protein PWR28_1296 [Synergistaceae bacterium]|nr:hypothetical protein [Synergistaceae bacterium]